jgi:hypothetical protein
MSVWRRCNAISDALGNAAAAGSALAGARSGICESSVWVKAVRAHRKFLKRLSISGGWHAYGHVYGHGLLPIKNRKIREHPLLPLGGLGSSREGTGTRRGQGGRPAGRASGYVVDPFGDELHQIARLHIPRQGRI